MRKAINLKLIVLYNSLSEYLQEEAGPGDWDCLFKNIKGYRHGRIYKTLYRIKA